PVGAEALFDPWSNVSFWTLVIFVVLLIVLRRYAYPPILGYAAAREQRIQDSLDEAKRQREEAEALLATQRRELAEAQREAQQVIAEGRQAAERLRQELLERARAEQEEIVARATHDIERERERAVESIRREAVELAIAAAAKLVGRKLSAEEDRRLVSEYLGRVESSGEKSTRAGVA
ncbi:MAG: F0F1 ATP synthase subunit B, partial [Longimicrobiales bacterium]